MRSRTIFITGASSGIGRALALEYGKRGAHLGLAARRKDELDKLAKEIEAHGGRAFVYPLDVSEPERVVETVKQADRDLGSLDMVVANAGITGSGNIASQPWEKVMRVIDVNVRGAMATLMAAIPPMMAQQKGHLVCVTSLAGRMGLPNFGAYSASKACMSTFLGTLRVDLGPLGIKVTDVQPGFVDTPIIDKNAHGVPLMWPVDKAARVIVKRLEGAPPVIAFPWPLAALTSLGRHVPLFVFDPMMRRLAARR